MKFAFHVAILSVTATAVTGCGSEFIDLGERRRLGTSRSLAEGTTWGYENDGASHWETISTICGQIEQSPIDIPAGQLRVKKIKSFQELGTLQPKYSLENATLVNNGHTVQVNLASQTLSANSLTKIIGRSKIPISYRLAQFHFHWSSKNSEGSEHTVNGDAFPLELHFVHYNVKYNSLGEAADKEDGLLVIGILFRVTELGNPGVANLTSALNGLKVGSATSVLINPSGFFSGIDLSKFYLYPGSLTTPNCYETVTWVVMEESVSISALQMAAFRDVPDLESFNFRPVQNLNQRTVYNRDMKVSLTDFAEPGRPTQKPTSAPSIPLTNAPTKALEGNTLTLTITTAVFSATTLILSICLCTLCICRRRTKSHPSVSSKSQV